MDELPTPHGRRRDLADERRSSAPPSETPGRAPTPERARDDLRYLDDLVRRTQARLDPHAFHFVHWGAIVLVWYPIANALQRAERFAAMAALGAGALVLGFTLSAVREIRLTRRPRLAGADTVLSRRIGWIVAACISAGALLSGLAPAFGFVHGPNVPILWGLVYANLAFMTGVIYERDFLWSGVFIFAGVLLAIAFQDWNGYVLGPFMGLGMIVPGLRAERRVRRSQETLGGVEAEPL